MAKTNKKRFAATYQLKVVLKDTEPPIWRMIQMPGDATLENLHEVIQIAMGWTNSHLHQFVLGETTYGNPDGDEDADDIEDEREHTISRVLPKEGLTIAYEYDFGDFWEHIISVEEIVPAGSKAVHPRCLGGARRCPPEDVGGSTRYARFLLAIKSPKHPERAEMLEWVGGAFDPEDFSVEDVNADLGRLLEAGSLAAMWPFQD